MTNDLAPPWAPAEDQFVLSVSGWAAVDLDPILRGEQATPPPSVFERVDGVRLFYAACVNALFGESESLKSWIVAVITVQLFALGLHVIYIDCEDGPETLIERLRALGATASRSGRTSPTSTQLALLTNWRRRSSRKR